MKILEKALCIDLGSFCNQITLMNRSSQRRCSVKKSVLRNFAKCTGKHLCQRLFFNKVTGLGQVDENTGQNNSEYGHFLRSVVNSCCTARLTLIMNYYCNLIKDLQVSADSADSLCTVNPQNRRKIQKADVCDQLF